MAFPIPDLWECPEGYVMFQQMCYKLFRQRKSHIMAHRHCEEEGEGGQLATPYTVAQVSSYWSVFGSTAMHM